MSLSHQHQQQPCHLHKHHHRRNTWRRTLLQTVGKETQVMIQWWENDIVHWNIPMTHQTLWHIRLGLILNDFFWRWRWCTNQDVFTETYWWDTRRCHYCSPAIPLVVIQLIYSQLNLVVKVGAMAEAEGNSQINYLLQLRQSIMYKKPMSSVNRKKISKKKKNHSWNKL